MQWWGSGGGQEVNVNNGRNLNLEEKVSFSRPVDHVV